MSEDCEHVCRCDCHEGKSMHFMECCSTCPDCKKHIVGSNKLQHEHWVKCHGHTEVDKN